MGNDTATRQGRIKRGLARLHQPDATATVLDVAVAALEEIHGKPPAAAEWVRLGEVMVDDEVGE